VSCRTASKREITAEMNGAPLRYFTVFLVTLLCITGMLVACAANRSVTASQMKGIEIKTTDPLEAFEKEYEDISEKVEEGSLPSMAMSRASVIRMGLKKYLINTEAQLEILRLDVMHGTDGQRETALNQIVKLVAEREQTKIAYLQELQALEGGSRTSEERTGKREAGKDLNIEIKIAPEHIGAGERP
jgi:hypothetical protein